MAFTPPEKIIALIDNALFIDYISCALMIAGWSSLVARRAHNPKVAGSNPASATKIPQFCHKSSFLIKLSSNIIMIQSLQNTK